MGGGFPTRPESQPAGLLELTPSQRESQVATIFFPLAGAGTSSTTTPGSLTIPMLRGDRVEFEMISLHIAAAAPIAIQEAAVIISNARSFPFLETEPMFISAAGSSLAVAAALAIPLKLRWDDFESQGPQLIPDFTLYFEFAYTAVNPQTLTVTLSARWRRFRDSL